jgi:hypothetical protein
MAASTAAPIDARWISCPKCSRRARAGQPFCELCGEKLLAAAGPAAATGGRTHRCEECGATVVVPENERTVTCAFCGTPYVASGEASPGRMAPEFVLPFGFGKREAEAAFKKWMHDSGWYRPGDLVFQGKLDALRGVYIPFWSFSMRSESEWSARIGEHWYETVVETYTDTVNGKPVTRTRTRQVQHTEWYPLAGRFHQFHSHYLVSASKGLPQDFADRIVPFPVSEMTRYAPHFLSGWLCEEYSMERDEAAKVSADRFREQERRDVAAFLPGDCHDSLSVSTDLLDVTEDLILLPIWVFAYSYAGKKYRYVLNGATGKAHGEKPVSVARIVLLIVAILLVILLAVAGVMYLSRR